MQWQLRGDRPIYQQLMEQLTEQIVSGQLGAGDKVPPVRELAAEAGVNPNTMQKALQELENRGLMQTQRTAGRTVTGDTALLEALRRQQAEAYAGEFLQKMQALGLTPQQVQELLHRMNEKKGESNV